MADCVRLRGRVTTQYSGVDEENGAGPLKEKNPDETGEWEGAGVEWVFGRPDNKATGNITHRPQIGIESNHSSYLALGGSTSRPSPRRHQIRSV